MPLVTTRPCPDCDGEGCAECNQTGEVALDPNDRHEQAEFNIKYVVGIVDDLEDKLNDCMNKLNDIWQKLNE